jgi:exodeoxyribonuclease VII large subunit
MFKSSVSSLKFKPENGMKVIAKGKISVFEPMGRYQVLVTSMQVDGIGDLFVAFELLKKKLESEGLFDVSKKKPIPKIPSSVGVITSPTGAAVRDIINVTGRRFPYANILLYPSLVQGESAATNLIKALDYFETTKSVDVIIIGRGGGSIEDLWAFNDEALARRIFSMSVPVISAVGHETDFTICDFVADLRAPTPSAAAEIAVPDNDEMLLKFENVVKRLKLMLKRKIEASQLTLDRYTQSRAFAEPSVLFENRFLIIDHQQERLYKSLETALANSQNNFAKVSAKLDALSPLKVLSRGYLFARNDQDKIIKSVDDVSLESGVKLRLVDGTVDCKINKINKDK